MDWAPVGNQDLRGSRHVETVTGRVCPKQAAASRDGRRPSCPALPPASSTQPGAAASVSKREQEGILETSRGALRSKDPQVRRGARGGTRTPKPFRAPGPKPGASASSATLA